MIIGKDLLMQVLYLLLNILCGDIDTGICLLLPKQQNRGRPIRIQSSEIRCQKLKVKAYHLPPLTRVIPRGAGKCPRSGQRGRPPSGAGEPNAMRRDWGRDKSELSACYAPFSERREGSLPPSRAARVPPPSSEGGKGVI